MDHVIIMMMLKTGRASFYMKRIAFAIIRFAVYSLVCGVFFMLGMELGRHEMQKHLKNSLNDSQLNHLNQLVAQSNDEELLAGNKVEDKGDAQGILPLPNQMRPGEMGKAFKLTKSQLTEDQKKLVKQGWDSHAFNQYVSDLISVERSLPDIRHPRCKEHKHLTNLPKTSVIICFHNEAWSTLLRSVHSVLNRSPPELIKEIILVDDCSEMDHLKGQLVQYMRRFPKVKIVRSRERVGLIKARMLGASVAKGRILTFLDSHIEATTGWLPPLLDRISRNYTHVVCPIIDVIDDDTLEVKYDKGNPDAVVHSIGIFDWSLTFNWMMMPERLKRDYNDSSQPFPSPTMAGGLFAINKRYFEHLGMYDPEFDIWGGENLELSFKTWMCGGTLEIVPCSHVGHIFRRRSPYEWRRGQDVIKKNLMRLGLVWLDDYFKHYQERSSKNDRFNYGDISGRQALRRRLGCKSFKWYIENVYPEIFIPDEGYAHGMIRNLGSNGTYCLDSSMDTKTPNTPISMYPCHSMGGNQHFTYTFLLEIRRDEQCVDYAGDKVMSFPCHGSKGNQEWRYDRHTKMIMHMAYGKCLTMVRTDSLGVMECRVGHRNQQWEFENYDPHATPAIKHKDA